MVHTVSAETGEEHALTTEVLQDGYKVKQKNGNVAMRYFTTSKEIDFFQEPSYFNKYTPKQLLQYALGANLYVPATQDRRNLLEKLINEKFENLGSITLCLEDAIREESLASAESNVLNLLQGLYISIRENRQLNLPLIFIRVRNAEQFRIFAEHLTKEHLMVLCGFCFPKFNRFNAIGYFTILQNLITWSGEVLYAMPILEDKTVMYIEHRVKELLILRQIMKRYESYILNIRVGGTDFSSLFGLRRDVYTTIYDLISVADCLTDIINVFMREESPCVVSGPVWEYYDREKDAIEMKNLQKELLLDIQNGFHGKTIIHPSQIDTVNKAYVVKYEEFQDANNIIQASGGVFANCNGKGMVEVNPHRRWAERVLYKAEIFGVTTKNSII